MTWSDNPAARRVPSPAAAWQAVVGNHAAIAAGGRLNTQTALVGQGRRVTRRRLVRHELAAAALSLFRKHGYDAVTVDDVAAAVGFSRRTFFRYFASKEDLVFDWITEQGEFVLPLLQNRPRSEPVWRSM